MGLFKKKKEAKALRLPEAPLTFPDLPEEEEGPNMPELPQLPQLPQLKPIGNLPTLEPQAPTMQQALPMPMGLPQLNKAPPMVPPMPQLEITRPKEPIFVKIDKFRDAMASFELVKKKLTETSSLLEKIKDTRSKEEAELQDWAEELGTIKQKISVIDKKIFGALG
ncbi:hypothetical protein ACFLZZ_02640 [Nanoarchaeota archaeon]